MRCSRIWKRECQMISWTQWFCLWGEAWEEGKFWALTICMAVKAIGSLRHRILSKKKKLIRNLPWETPPFYGQIVEKTGRKGGEKWGERRRGGEISQKGREIGRLLCTSQGNRWKPVWGGGRNKRKVNRRPKNRCLSHKFGLWRGEERLHRLETNIRARWSF